MIFALGDPRTCFHFTPIQVATASRSAFVATLRYISQLISNRQSTDPRAAAGCYSLFS